MPDHNREGSPMTTTTTDTPTDTTDPIVEAARAADHAEASSLAVIRPEQQRFDENQRAILRQLGIEDATDGDLDLFFHVCRTTGLDPFRKQIYMIGRNTRVSEWVDTESGGRRKEERWVTKYTIQTGIDGYRRNVRQAASRLRDELSVDGPWYTGKDDFHVNDDGEVIQHWRKVWPLKSPPHAARFVTYRNGESFEGIAHFDDFVQTNNSGEPNSMWSKMPRNQIGKCAETLSYKRAYPDDLSGLIFEDSAQPTILDQDGKVLQGGSRTPVRPAAAPVTVDEILGHVVANAADRVDAEQEPEKPKRKPRKKAEPSPDRAEAVEAAKEQLAADETSAGQDDGNDQGEGAESSSGATLSAPPGDQPTPTTDVAMISDDQLQKLRGLLAMSGFDETDEGQAGRRDFCQQAVKRELATLRDLTAEEAAGLIEILDQEPREAETDEGN